VAGPAIALVHRFLHDEEDTDVDLWSRALDDTQSTARESAMQVCAMFGSAAGDIALTHGARAVVLVGGMTQRISTLLADSLFMSRFTAKGRFKQVVTQMPVKILKCDEAGLIGAALAFASK
jgi:glucokinase